VPPDSACGYHNNESDQLQCPKLDRFLDRNPIEYAIKSFTFRSGMRNTKELLVTAKWPLLFSLPMPAHRYWFDCNNSLVRNDESCRRGLFDCGSR